MTATEKTSQVSICDTCTTDANRIRTLKKISHSQLHITHSSMNAKKMVEENCADEPHDGLNGTDEPMSYLR